MEGFANEKPLTAVPGNNLAIQPKPGLSWSHLELSLSIMAGFPSSWLAPAHSKSHLKPSQTGDELLSQYHQPLLGEEEMAPKA
jgi:hypothetical protein